MRQHEQGFSHVLLFLLLVVVIGAIGFAGWRVYQLQAQTSPGSQSTLHNIRTATQPTGPTTEQEQAAQVLAAHASAQAAKDLITNIQSDLNKQFVVDPYTNTPGGYTSTASGAGHISMRTIPRNETGNEFQWYTPGYNFGVLTLTTATELKISYTSTSDEKKIDDTILAHFSAAHMALQTLPASAPVIDQLIPNVPDVSDAPPHYYANNTIVCNFGSYALDGKTSPLDNGREMSFTCDTTSDFAAISIAAKPLADAYIAANPSQNNKVTFTLPKIIDSKNTGYKIALFMDSVAPHNDYTSTFWNSNGNDALTSDLPSGVFYMKGGTWNFYAVSATYGLRCNMSNYPTDVRLAFQDQQCNAATN